MKLYLGTLVLLATLVLGCSEEAATPTTALLPTIVAFDASEKQIIQGQSTTLIWNVTSATMVVIDQGVGQVQVAGTRQVTPDKNTTYTISASGGGQSVVKSVTVSVNPRATTTPTATGTATSTPAAQTLSLIEARTRGLLDFTVYGTFDLSKLDFRLTSKSSEKVEVIIPMGMAWRSPTAGDAGPTSDMVVKTQTKVTLMPRSSGDPNTVPALSIGMFNPEPTGNESLLPLNEAVPAEVLKLFKLPEFAGETFRVQQYAVWTIMHNPLTSAYPWIAEDSQGRSHTWLFNPLRGSSIPPLGWSGSPPSSYDFGKVALLFEKAGIPVSNYNALRQ